MLFLVLLLLACGTALGAVPPPEPDVTPVNYTDGDVALVGYLSLPDVTFPGVSLPAPAVVIIPDWDGVNLYEQQRATLIAQDLGYVAFAADIYGADKQMVESMDERIELSSLYRDDPALFAQRINAAIATVKEMEDVDADNVAAIGYCFGGTGVISYTLVGEGEAKALVSFHGGLASIPEAGPPAAAKLLVLSGGDDDASSDVVDLEDRLNAANATWEITRYSGIEHAFTKWDDERYNELVDYRSWTSMAGFLAEAFGTPFDGQQPAQAAVTPVPYTDVDGTELAGYLSIPDPSTFPPPSPLVVILPDWDGVNEYEKERATILASEGYVAFAADIYGADLQEDLDEETRIQEYTKYTSDPDLYVQRIQLAIATAKEQFPDAQVAVIGYCFGGTGVIELAFAGVDVEAVVAFHGGLQDLPMNTSDIAPYVLVLSGGVDDAHGNQTELEMELDARNATWEVTRYANVEHGFTVWGGGGYNLLADARSWESMMTLFNDIMPVVQQGGSWSASLRGVLAVVFTVMAFLLM